MRKLVVSEFVSLDGIFEDPGGAESYKYGGWTMSYSNDEFAQFKGDEIKTADALLLGRITYEGFAKAWPNMQGAGEYGEWMNGTPKYVISKTLKKADWNNSMIISGNVVEEMSKIKQGVGKDILVFGSGQLSRFLLENNLVDQINLLVYPVILGEGKRLFAGSEKKELQLVEAKTFKTGIVSLIYQPKS